MALRDRGGKLDVARQSALADAGECAVEFVKARPECRLKKWDGEADIGIRYAGVSAQLEELSRAGERVKWGSGDLHIEAYTLPPGPGMEDGGLELELMLAVQPPTNRFDFLVDGAEDYDWWFQPPLTPEQFASGRRRPENVVNSYAVYHKNRRDHIRGQKNYGTGKAFHVYRPKLIDANGVETWGTLSYADGVLTVEIPQDALDKAAYPARVDPTFGNENLQSSSYGIQGYLFGGPGTPASDGEVDSIHVGCSPDTAANVKGVLILRSTETLVANGVTPEVSIPATGMNFKTLAYSTKPVVAAGTLYYACFIIDPLAPTTVYAYDTGGTAGTVEDGSNTYSSPTDLVSPSYYNEISSFYATYTESGGAEEERDAEDGLYFSDSVDASVTSPQQEAYPSSDIDAGQWLPSTGGVLYAMVDETVVDDADFIYTNTLGACALGLQTLTDPAVDTGHVVSYRARGDGVLALRAKLWQGSAEIASWVTSGAPYALTTYVQSLSTTEASSITNYADLRLSFEMF